MCNSRLVGNPYLIAFTSELPVIHAQAPRCQGGHTCGQPIYRELSPYAERGGVAGGSQFLPVGTLRRSSSKKFSKTTTLSVRFCSCSFPAASKTTAERLPSGAKS